MVTGELNFFQIEFEHSTTEKRIVKKIFITTLKIFTEFNQKTIV